LSLNLPLVAICGTLCDRRIWAPVLGEHNADATIVVAGQVDGKAADSGDVVAHEQRMGHMPEKFVLAGFSLGGLVALEIIAQYRERVAGLALICADFGVEMGQGAAARRLDEAHAAVKWMKAHALADLWPRFNAQGEEGERPMLQWQRPLEKTSIVFRTIWRLHGATAAKVRLRLLDLSCWCQARKIRFALPSRHEAIMAELPNEIRVVIETSGHMIAFDQPKKLSNTLGEWIAAGKTLANGKNRDERHLFLEKV